MGFALIAYVEAMLGFETDKIQIALDRIAAAEILSRQFSKKARRRNWHNHYQKSSNNQKFSNPEQESPSEPIIPVSFEDISTPSDASKKKIKTPDIQYELLATNCMLMSSTIQFLRNSWLEYMKAAYKLRKAYKLYEQMFESLTGQKASEYASNLKRSAKPSTTTPKRKPEQSLTTLSSNSPQARASWNEKRLSLFYQSTNRKTSFESISAVKRRPMSTIDLYSIENMSSSDSSIITIENTIESGIFFGIGLFSLIFSLLPPRGIYIYIYII